MTKSTIKRIISTIIFFILAYTCLFATEYLSRNELNSLYIKCQNETVFTHDEVQFILEIPKTDLSDIQFDMPELPLGVKFISSMKTSALESDSGGEITNGNSKIQFWFSFSDSGDVKIPPITARIGGRTVYIPFEQISVFENPAVLSPLIFVEFPNGEDFYVGENVKIDVYIQFCVQILNFSFKIPKNAIFKEIERDEFTKGDIRKTDFSVEKIKIASFMWKPLESGETPIPDITLDTIAYNGDRRRISTSDLMRIVQIKNPRNNLLFSESHDGLFDAAFSTDSDDGSDNFSNESSVPQMTKSDVVQLVELRSNERHSFPFSGVVKERIAFEEKFGFDETDSESSVPIFILFSFLSLCAIVLHLIMVLKKHVKSAVFYSILFILFIILSIRQNLHVRQRYAISVGGQIFSVPEENRKSVNAGRFMPNGVRLKIVENVGDWYYIECSEMSGWTKSDSVIIIQ